MTTPLRTAQSRLANAVRYGSPDDIAAARAAFHTEKLRVAIMEHAPLASEQARRDLTTVLESYCEDYPDNPLRRIFEQTGGDLL